MAEDKLRKKRYRNVDEDKRAERRRRKKRDRQRREKVDRELSDE